MAIDLTNKPIVITGAGTGIGRATALACARAGMPVVLGGRRLNKLHEVQREIESINGKAHSVRMDVTVRPDCDRCIQETISTFGSIYAVYANAGYGIERSIADTSDAEFRAIFETNFWGTIHIVQPALEHMRRARQGHVLLCASAIGKIGIPYYGAYCATKAAQSIVGRSMRHELRSEGVHVSTIHPVLTKTDFAAVAQQLSNTDSRKADDMPGALKQSPERIAQATVRALRRPRTEVWTSLPTRWLFGLLNASPRLADSALDRFAMPKQRQPD